MVIAGRIFAVLGIGLLLCAFYFLAAAFVPQNGFLVFPPAFFLTISAVFAAPGIGLLMLGSRMVRKVRDEREGIEELERKRCALRGMVCDRNGVPIPKAQVDVFVEGPEEKKLVTSVRAGSGGRFAADLPDGQYLLEVGVPEIGFTSLQVRLPNAGDNGEVQIKFEAARSNAEMR